MIDADLAKDVEKTLHWALDILDRYDRRLVELGDPSAMVYSRVHLAGKQKARTDLSRLVTAVGCCGLGDDAVRVQEANR